MNYKGNMEATVMSKIGSISWQSILRLVFRSEQRWTSWVNYEIDGKALNARSGAVDSDIRTGFKKRRGCM